MPQEISHQTSSGPNAAALLANSNEGWYREKMYGEGVTHVGRKERLAAALLPVGEKLRVLDVGCGVGRFLTHLTDLGHEAWGVEISRASCREAMSRGHRVVQGSADDLRGHGLTDGTLNAVSYLDVLEHLFNPAATLAHAAPLLAPGGVFIVCVPNIGSIVGRLTLLCGRFPLNDQGLFDHGHVRWFTRENLAKHFAAAAVLDEGSLRCVPLEPLQRWGLWRLEKLQERVLGFLAQVWPSLWAHEFIFRLTPLLPGGKPGSTDL
jgi:2-polyprenyl-3-methyl-5-hydroxy-6-metoxy-1,4-benzoquinol methylase